MNTISSSRVRGAAFTVAILLLVSYLHEILSKFHFYRALYKQAPWYLVEGIDKLLGAAICVVAIWLISRSTLSGVLRELGFTRRVLPAFGFALLVTSPMLVGFGLTRGVPPNLSLPSLLFLTVFSPIVEEIEYRGYAFRQLLTRARWRFWWAAFVPAILFGLGHVEKGQGWKEVAGIFMITGIGALLVSWLLYRWNNLWVPIAIHIFMNLWWGLFSVARTVVGGWFPFALQTVSMLLAIVFTLLWTRRPEIGVAEQERTASASV